MKLKTLFFAILIICSCADNKKNENVVMETRTSTKKNHEVTDAIILEVYDYAGLEEFLNNHDDKIHVVNFWATWCAPCVKELPYFEKLNEHYASKNVEVLLVSLDFPHLYDSKLKPFIKRNGLKSKVIALDDVDMNSWIPKVDKGWSGSIPATLIYRNDVKEFYERSFTYSGLEEEINKFIN
ncbi:TlpA disulfide reductase family protein [Changchengzhania lutea]|uniref:TlpA disulfide reductase family protein n=1 Tax=Changchengzhania lutea TaxID=2049305 RepID=UPI00115E77C1|nr:TlpA disulfide reductase family protein [Changchengzhania lutea]